MGIVDRSASASAGRSHGAAPAQLPTSQPTGRRHRRTVRSLALTTAAAVGLVVVASGTDVAADDPPVPVAPEEALPATDIVPPALPSPADEESIFDELTPAEVLEVLEDDHFSFDGGNIVVEDPAPLGPFLEETGVIEAAGATDGTDAPFSAASFDDAFSLHSRPEATLKIFLDFDGHTVTGTSWNSTVPVIEAGRYRREAASNPDSGFTQRDLDGIVEIWERVAEDFAPWEVDVTTEDPGVDGLSRNGVGDVEYGIRTIITPDYEWYDSRRFGGVAYLRSFTRSSDLPAWVFSSNLGTGNPKSVAEAVSHEVGHTLGLGHDGHDDGSTSSGYYSGHGDWAPIMGVGYYKTVTQWSNGGYPGATNLEDDLYIIDGFLERRSATAGGEAATLPNGGPSSTQHVLDDGGATNVHSLFVSEGPVSVQLDKVDANGNLLANLTIRDPLGNVVSSASPIHAATWSLNASLPASVEPGTYSVEVRSIGWNGSGAGDPGFSHYGSIGAYEIDIDMATSSTPPPPPSDPPDTPPTTNPPPSSPPPADPPTPQTPTETFGDFLTPITPLRVFDSRIAGSSTNAVASTGARISAGQNVRLDLPAPAGTSAAVVNVVAADAGGTGWLSVTPCTQVARADRTSTLNFSPAGNIANSVITPLTTSGEVCIYTSTSTHVVVDVTAWIGDAGNLTLDEVGSTRVVDSRDGLGVPRRLRAGTTARIDLSDVVSGSDIRAVSLNLTAIRPETRGFLAIDDCTTKLGTTSSLNVRAGEVRGNNGVFALGAGQLLCVSTTTTTDLTIDVTGEFGTGAGYEFVAATPERVLDTRDRSPVAALTAAAFDLPAATLADGRTIPAQAVSVNLTAARPNSSGFVTAWNCGPRPQTSALNARPNASTANGAVVSLPATGRACLFHSAGGHLIVDLAGWWV